MQIDAYIKLKLNVCHFKYSWSYNLKSLKMIDTLYHKKEQNFEKENS
jgi:hypothetical protein